MSQSSCPLCGSGNKQARYPSTRLGDEPAARVEDFVCTNSGLGRHGPIVQCRSCELLYNEPMPSASQLEAIYAAVEDPRYLAESSNRVQTFSRLLERLAELAPHGGRLLEIGCYTGVFLDLAAEAGWTVEGHELSAWAAQIARQRGHSVCEGVIDEIEGEFDLVVLWDVIEHVPNPLELMRSVARLTAPGGTVALSTHLVDSLPVRMMGKRYPFFMEMHVVHFSRSTMRRLLVDSGFQEPVIEPHVRVLSARYFFEKLASITPGAGFLFQAVGKALGERSLPISGSGVFNIYALK